MLIRLPILKGTTVNLKTRLADVCHCPDEHWRKHGGKVAAKHLDFVIADYKTTKPLLAIELDDRSHENPSAMERDAFKDQALRDVGLPLLRVRTANWYDLEELEDRIREACPELAERETNRFKATAPSAFSSHRFAVESDSVPTPQYLRDEIVVFDAPPRRHGRGAYGLLLFVAAVVLALTQVALTRKLDRPDQLPAEFEQNAGVQDRPNGQKRGQFHRYDDVREQLKALRDDG